MRTTVFGNIDDGDSNCSPSPSKNHLVSFVFSEQVATVIPTPTVYPSTNLLYLTKSPWVMVNGTNFDEKNTALFFNPPLIDGSDINTFVSFGVLGCGRAWCSI